MAKDKDKVPEVTAPEVSAPEALVPPVAAGEAPLPEDEDACTVEMESLHATLAKGEDPKVRERLDRVIAWHNRLMALHRTVKYG
jgi:hypothetical protein